MLGEAYVGIALAKTAANTADNSPTDSFEDAAEDTSHDTSDSWGATSAASSRGGRAWKLVGQRSAPQHFAALCSSSQRNATHCNTFSITVAIASQVDACEGDWHGTHFVRSRALGRRWAITVAWLDVFAFRCWAHGGAIARAQIDDSSFS